MESVQKFENCNPQISWSPVLSPKESMLSQSNNYKVASHHRHRRFVSGMVYLLFTTSFIYLVAGPWVGWDGTLYQQTALAVCSTAAFVRWPLKKSIMKLAPHGRAKKWQIQVYCLIPWRTLSRSWGLIAAMPIPKLARPVVFGVYSKLFGVEMGESELPLKHYPSICDFFTRRLRENARSVDTCGLMVSPCDGTVVQCGPISDKYVKKVKGVDYCIETFLGSIPSQDSFFWLDNVKTNRHPHTKTQLFQCVLYLAPGDYHRFHSPCKWEAFQRLHFHGQLLSVAPSVARWMPNLLTLNERVVYSGLWDHGFFSYTAVGATNVGSIIVHNDPELQTNKHRSPSKVDYTIFTKEFKVERGEEMGMFAMGSTIVLIFEAPDNFQFIHKENDRVKLGSCLGGLDFFPSQCFQNNLTDEDCSDSSELSDGDYDFIGSEKVLVS